MQNAYTPYNNYYVPSFGQRRPSTTSNEELAEADWESLYESLITGDALPAAGQDLNTSVAPELVRLESPPLEAFNYAVNQWQYNSSNVGQTYEYNVPHQYDLPSMRQPASSYVGYPPYSSYRTQWELGASNPPNISQSGHIGFEMSTFDISQNSVMQQFQEPGYIPAYGTNNFFTGANGGTVSLDTISILSTLPALSSTPISFSNTHQTIPSPSFQPLPTPTAVPVPQHQTQSQVPPKKKKRARKPKKGTPIPVPGSHSPPKRRSKYPVRSQEWLDKYFYASGKCRLCTGGCKEGRADRLLEHLVSSHCVQVMKGMESFDESELAKQAKGIQHFITTEAAFEYTRRHIDIIRCSLCESDSSLIFRPPAIGNHLRRRTHRKLDKATREKEETRLRELEPKKEVFYSLNDKFLYYYPGGLP